MTLVAIILFAHCSLVIHTYVSISRRTNVPEDTLRIEEKIPIPITPRTVIVWLDKLCVFAQTSKCRNGNIVSVH